MSQDNGRHDPMAPANANRIENSENQYSQQGQANQGRQDWNQHQASEGESGQSIGGEMGSQGQSGIGQSGQDLGGPGIGEDQYGNRNGQAQQFDQSADQPWGNADTDGDLMSQVREHMDVVGPDGQSVGKVDSVEGDRIKLTRSDSTDGQHHYISASQIDGIEDGQLRLSHYANSDSGAVSDMGYASTDSVNTGSGYASGK